MSFASLFGILALIISGCASTAEIQPTLTPLPTSTYTLTPEPTATLIPNSPAPAGFEWKNVPDFNFSILVPDDWFFKMESQGNVEAFFVTKENIEETGRYSTGLGININQNVDNVDETARSFINNIANQDTTTKVIDSIQISSNTKVAILYVIVIEAELPINPNDPVPTPNKTLAYHALADTETNTLYILIFESPQDQWESEWNEHGFPIASAFVEAIFGDK